ncbi:hypothetical protein SLE2022_352530 [Rubroshorea leprosula]
MSDIAERKFPGYSGSSMITFLPVCERRLGESGGHESVLLGIHISLNQLGTESHVEVAEMPGDRWEKSVKGKNSRRDEAWLDYTRPTTHR